MKKFKIIVLLSLVIVPSVKTINYDKVLGGLGIAGSAAAFYFFAKTAKINNDIHNGNADCDNHKQIKESEIAKHRLRHKKTRNIFAALCVPVILYGITSYRLLKKS